VICRAALAFTQEDYHWGEAAIAASAGAIAVGLHPSNKRTKQIRYCKRDVPKDGPNDALKGIARYVQAAGHHGCVQPHPAWYHLLS
jgi:hypothetical protein